MAIVLPSAIVDFNVPIKHFTDSGLQKVAKFNTNLNEDNLKKRGYYNRATIQNCENFLLGPNLGHNRIVNYVDNI